LLRSAQSVDDHPLAVDVGDLQVESFLTAKASAVVYGQRCAVLESDAMQMRPANPKANSVRNNGPELLAEVEAAAESGLLPL
jgi:hypothetical protein